MVDWNDIKKAFQTDIKTPEQIQFETEKRLLANIADYLSLPKGVSSVKGYQPEEVSEFLSKPVSEIRQILGGEWLEMDEDKFDLLIYTLIKKVKKSEKLLEWQE